MKKSLLLVLLTIILVSSLAFAACDLIDPDKGWGTVFTYETAYAEAQELGYTGSLQEFIDSIKGKDGANGKDGVGIKSVAVNDQGKLIVTLTNDTVIDCGSVKGPQGETGPQGPAGATGNGIASIAKTSSVGLVDIYTITYTNGSTTTFTVTNGQDGQQGIQGIQGKPGTDGHTPVITIQEGYWYIDGVNTNILAEGLKGETGNGIASIEKTNTEGLVDTYTITFTDGTTTTFTVTNGKDGQDGEQGIQGIQGVPGKDGHTPVITIQEGYWYIDGVNTNVLAEGLKGETGNGIASIEKTNTEGLVDTYTITFTDGTTTTFTVTNGKDGETGPQGNPGSNGTNGITPLLKIGEDNYWYVSYDNGKTWTSLGIKATGSDGANGEQGEQGVSIVGTAFDENGNMVITYSDGTTQIVEHNWQKLYVLEQANCQTDGKELYSCTDCGLVRVIITPQTGHTDGAWTTDLEPTCTVDGSKHQVCAVCGETLKTESIDATGHSYVATVVDPTCITQGYTLHTCSVCGDNYKDTFVDANGEHNFQESETCAYCEQNIADVAVDSYNISATADDNVRGYVVPRMDGKYDVYIKGTGAMKDYTPSNTPFYVDGYTPKNAYIQNGVTSIGNYAFSGCRSLTRITIPDSVTSIGIYAFRHCSSLTSITIPDSVTSIGNYAFEYCSRLTNVYLTDIAAWCNIYFSNYYANPFYYADNLYVDNQLVTELVIPDSVTSIGKYAFDNCSSLTSITIPDSVTSIGADAFYNCSSLTSITIPDSVTSIGADAFYNCSSLTSITIPDSVTYIGADAFAGTAYYNDTNNWQNKVLYIGNCLIEAKTTIVECTIKEGTTVIANSAFSDCDSLTSITIPDSVTSIGNSAFYGCSSLTTVYYAGTEEQWNNITIGSSNSYLANANIVFNHPDHNYVPTVTAPTCVAQGYTEYYCTICNYLEKGDYVPALGHDYSVYVSTVPPTCGDYGYDIYKCSMCESNFYDYNRDPLYGQGCQYDILEVIEPTCESGGYKRSTCAICGHYFDTDEVGKLGHDEIEHVAQVPTCTAIGWDAYVTCSRCDYTTYVEIPATGHSHEAVVTAPTCTEQGYTTHTCSACGDSYVDSYVDATGHNYKNKVCTVCGDKEPSLGLAYTLSEDETYYILSGIGSCPDIDVVIPTTYKEKPVTSIGDYAFYNCSSLTSITIPDSVTTIGGSAFAGCSSLISVIIGNSVTSIGGSAFGSCTGLTSITIPDGVTSIGYQAFYGCSSLTSIIVDADNSNYKSVDGNVYSKDGKTLVHYAVGKTDTSFTIPDSVTSIGGYAFGGCTGLTSITIPDSVTSIGDYAFGGFTGLTSITIPDSVTTIGYYAFGVCTGLTSITIPDSVTSISKAAFLNCSSLTSITIPSSVTSIGDSAFYYCSSLTSITIPSSVTSIGDSAFRECSSLTSIMIPNSVTSIGNSAFQGCRSLTSITIPDSVTSIGKWVFSGCSSLTSIAIPDSVTSIGSGAFYNCSSLTSITIPFVGATLNGTSNTHFGYIFYASSYSHNPDYVPKSLKTVVITGSSSVGDYAFYGCSSLTSIAIPDSVTSIGSGAFYYCKSLTSIIIPDSVTSIGEYTFKDCNSLTSITIPDSVTFIGNYAFRGCTSLTSITIPDGVTSIGNYAFYDCSSLTSITIPDSVTYIGDYAFRYCSSLTSITIPDSVTSIGSYAFNGCSSLTSVAIGNSVTSIGSGAFYGCSSLTSITIPSSVTSIGWFAFYGCSSLTNVYYTGTQEQWEVISIGSDNTSLTNANIVFNYTGDQGGDITPPAHECESVCEICGGCLDESCTEDVCATKCECNQGGTTPPKQDITITFENSTGSKTLNGNSEIEFSANRNVDGWEVDRGLQFQKQNGAVTIVSTSSVTDVASITLDISANKTINVTVIVKVGSTTFTCDGQSSVTFQNINHNILTFTTSSPVSGVVTIEVVPETTSGSGLGSIYFKTITISTTSTGGTTPPSGNENVMPEQSYNKDNHEDYDDILSDAIKANDEKEGYLESTALPSQGTYDVLVIPVEFSNDKFTSQELTDLNDAFNNKNNTGWESVSSYYQKSSYGKLNLTFDIADKVTLGSTYGSFDGGNDYGADILKLAMDALEARGFDFTKYDHDNNGVIDGVYIIYSSPIDYDGDYYWAYITATGDETEYDGLYVYTYLFASVDFMYEDIETSGSDYAIDGLKLNAVTYIHETGHMLGLDDYYDYNPGQGSDQGLGNADMMDYTVGDHNAYSKLLLGWVKPTVVTSTQTVTISAFESSGQFIMVLLDYDGTYFSEYLIIDLYSATGLNALHAGTEGSYLYDGAEFGARIYHVDATIANPYSDDYYSFTDNNNSLSRDPLIKLVEADGDDNFESDQYQGYGYAAEDDLWQTGDVLSEVHANYTRNDGKVVNFDITFDSVTASSLTITVTFGVVNS